MSSDHRVQSDPNFLLYVRFYSESWKDETYEARIRADYGSSTKRGLRKQAEAMVSGYRSFDTVRQGVLQQFVDEARKIPNCAVLPVLKDLDRSMACTFTTTREPFECCVTGDSHPMGVIMTLTPDPDNPFGPVAKTYALRSDFKKLLQAYRILARFRYVVMKYVVQATSAPTQVVRPLHENMDKCQEVYDKYLHAQKMLLYVIQEGRSL